METKRLMRSSQDRMIAGVCAGLARYFGVDPVLVRVIFVVLALLGAGGILIYIILWILMPQDEIADSTDKPEQP